MLEVKNVVKEFKTGDSRIKPVDGVTFSLPQGTFAAVLGRSGSGKSTLLSILGALDKATSGDVIVNGVNISALPAPKLTEYRRNDIGFVFQEYNLIPNLTALENVMLPMEFAGMGREPRAARAAKLLNEVELGPDLHTRKANRLSGGQQQRVSIARALANRPQLILADEPTGNLDEETGELIIELLRNLSRREDTTILVATHDQALAGKTDRRLRLVKGKVTEE